MADRKEAHSFSVDQKKIIVLVEPVDALATISSSCSMEGTAIVLRLSSRIAAYIWFFAGSESLHTSCQSNRGKADADPTVQT